MRELLSSKRVRRNNAWYFLILLLPLIWYIFVFVVPMAQGIGLSLFRWDGLSPDKTFIGLENYKILALSTPKFWPAFFNSIKYVLFVVIGCVIISIFLSILIYQKSRLNNFFRAMFYLPCVLSTTAVAFMWNNAIYNPNIGILNRSLEAMGLDFLTHVWLGEPGLIIFSIGAIEIYMNLGTSILLFIAGLQDIPLELHESAKIDGANRIQVFFKITLPLLAPTTSLVTVLTMISAMRSFDIMYVLSNKTTQVLATFLYDEMFTFRRVGTGSAAAVILFLLVLVMNGIQKLVIKEDV